MRAAAGGFKIGPPSSPWTGTAAPPAKLAASDSGQAIAPTSPEYNVPPPRPLPEP